MHRIKWAFLPNALLILGRKLTFLLFILKLYIVVLVNIFDSIFKRDHGVPFAASRAVYFSELAQGG